MRWSDKSLAELEAVYWDVIAPEMRRDGLDPAGERPTYAWLTDHGFSGIDYALRRHHDLTLTEFFAEVVSIPGVGGGGNRSTGDDGEDHEHDRGIEYDWGIDHDGTRRELSAYIHTLEKRRRLAESTCRTKRARLAKYARLHAEIHGSDDLLSPAGDAADRSAAIERALAVFDAIDAEFDSDDSKLRYLGDVRQFYEHLVRRAKVVFNPVENVAMEYAWERSEPDNPALSAADVRAMYETADSLGDRLLVVGLAGWGLRPNELASLHRSQIELGTDPHLAFEERKNGPGTVALIYGVDEIEERIAELVGSGRHHGGDDVGGRSDDWNGYLFPSSHSRTGHIATKTVQARFEALAERAGVTVRGSLPTPKMGRRFWYTTYLDSVETLLDTLDAIAGDQGSADASVVARNYLSEDKRREQRRSHMREALAEAFDGGAAPPAEVEAAGGDD